MTVEQAERFAKQWVEEWNRRDVEAVLAHFSDEVVFASPRAQQVVGEAEVRGKAALRAYWNKALEKNSDLHFTLESVAAGECEIGIRYQALVNGKRYRAVEWLIFDASGLAVRGEGLYGAEI